MKAPDMRKKSPTELTKELNNWRIEIATLVREHSLSENKNVRQIRSLRKDIARALTILSEKTKAPEQGAK